MTDLDGELEALRREARRKLDDEKAQRREPDVAPAPAVSRPAARDAAEQDDDAVAHAAQTRALELAARALVQAPDAAVKGARLAGKAKRLSLLQKLVVGVLGLVALVALWRIVFQPLIVLAILIGVVAILVLLIARFFGSDEGDDDADEKD
jgi:hypothetical protein